MNRNRGRFVTREERREGAREGEAKVKLRKFFMEEGNRRGSDN